MLGPGDIPERHEAARHQRMATEQDRDGRVRRRQGELPQPRVADSVAVEKVAAEAIFARRRQAKMRLKHPRIEHERVTEFGHSHEEAFEPDRLQQEPQRRPREVTRPGCRHSPLFGEHSHAAGRLPLEVLPGGAPNSPSDHQLGVPVADHRQNRPVAARELGCWFAGQRHRRIQPSRKGQDRHVGRRIDIELELERARQRGHGQSRIVPEAAGQGIVANHRRDAVDRRRRPPGTDIAREKVVREHTVDAAFETGRNWPNRLDSRQGQRATPGERDRIETESPHDPGDSLLEGEGSAGVGVGVGVDGRSRAGECAGLIGGDDDLRDASLRRERRKPPGRRNPHARDQPLGRGIAAAAMEDNQRRTVHGHGFMVARSPVSCIAQRNREGCDMTNQDNGTSEALATMQAAAAAAIDAASAQLRELSLDIHANPELLFQEHRAHALLSDYLEKQGFQVERGAYELATAFEATTGSGGPTLAVYSEYDALPGIGHACGHNLIAISGVATALALKAALGEGQGTVVLLGSPAEEGGGGKIFMHERGALEGVDAALMLHPAPDDSVWFTSNAIQSLRLEYFGKNAHAAGSPWEGVNALDAMVAAYNNVSMLRQQMHPSDRVHGVILEGGLKPNIIPDHTLAEWYIRAATIGELHALKPRVVACFEAAAQATGCTMELTWTGREYADVLTNDAMGERYATHLRALGGSVAAKGEPGFGGFSTDMGNVSYVVPSIHPMFRIPVTPGAGNHTAGFTACAATEEAHAATLRASKALAFAALDLYTDPELLAAAKAEFARATA